MQEIIELLSRILIHFELVSLVVGARCANVTNDSPIKFIYKIVISFRFVDRLARIFTLRGPGNLCVRGSGRSLNGFALLLFKSLSRNYLNHFRLYGNQ